MFIYIFFAAIGLVLVILLYIFSKLFIGTALGDKVKKKLSDGKNKFLWNGAIRSFSVSFIKLGIASSIQIMMQVSDSNFIKEGEKIQSLVIFSFLVISIIFFYVFIRCN